MKYNKSSGITHEKKSYSICNVAKGISSIFTTLNEVTQFITVL
jgi:hypothetical protein